MSNHNPADRPPLHVEVAVAAILAGLILTGGGIASVVMEDWKPVLVCAIIACGLIFLGACLPQLRAARQASIPKDPS
jgi:hypothetical protein